MNVQAVDLQAHVLVFVLAFTLHFKLRSGICRHAARRVCSVHAISNIFILLYPLPVRV